jgi:hypothetical protein
VSQYTPRIANRTALATLIRDKHMARATQVGLTMADLNTLIDSGTAAARADAEQREQLAAGSAQRSERKAEKDALFDREDAMRNRLPAVIADLRASGQPASATLATWLERLTFARYRFRDLPAPAAVTEPATAAEQPTPAELEEIRRVQRVEREDVPTRSTALAAFCRAILKPGREAIVAAFSARGLPRAEIEVLGNDAEALAGAGRNVPLAAEATRRESDAVDTQKAKWEQVRRMMRAAVAGNAELKEKYGVC